MDKHQWISFFGCEAPIAMKEFMVQNPETAEIDICGLGYFELYINGKKVSEDLLVPAWSEYEQRGDMHLNYPMHNDFNHRIYYLNYNLKEYLVSGKNRLEVLLGNGFYNQKMRMALGYMVYGKPKLCFVLKVDGTEICSDEETLWKPSYITENNVYYGELHDFSMKELDFWHKPQLIEGPKGPFYLQDCPTDKVIRTIIPKKIGEELYDVGENISGRVRFYLEGIKATVSHAELLEEDGYSLNFVTAGQQTFSPAQIQRDIYIGSGNECYPHFSWKGFRYFKIDAVGEIRDIVVEVIHTDIKQVSFFECDNDVLNFISDAYVRTQLNNIHGCVPSDCPHRERLGYTGDGQLCCDVAMTMFDSEKLYEKWIRDIADGQDKATGRIQNTAPFAGGGGGPGGWGSAIVTVPYQMYRHFGRKDLLEQYYPNMKQWVMYMENCSEGNLVVRSEENSWCLGDWCLPDGLSIPEPLVNSYFLVKSYERMQEISDLLGYGDDYSEEISKVKDALVKNYYNEEKNSFGLCGADAFMIDIGLGNTKMLQAMKDYYEDLGEFDTGIFGTDVLIDVLFSNGYGNTAFRLLSSEKDHSFGKWMNMGDTTLPEYWYGSKTYITSHSHPMFGGVIRSFFTHILGISEEQNEVIVCPCLLNGLNEVKGSVQLKSGKVEISCIKKDNQITFTGSSDCHAQLEFNGKRYPITNDFIVSFSLE